MNSKDWLSLWGNFKNFFMFSPIRQIFILLLLLLQGITTGIGLLFIMPLLQILGLDTGNSFNSSITNTANWLFMHASISLTLINVLIIYILIVSLIATLRYQLSIQSVWLQQRYIAYLRNQLYRKLIHSHWQFIVSNKMSDFIHSLTVQVQAVGQTSQLMINLVSQLILSLVLFILLFLLSWQMTLLASGFALLLLLALLPLSRVIYGSGKSHEHNFKSIFQMLVEQLGSLKMIKSYASEAHYADKIQQTSEKLEKQQIRFSQINAMTQWISSVGAVLAFSLFFYVAHTILVIPLASILLLLIVFSRLIPKISGLQRTYHQLIYKMAACTGVNEMLMACDNEQEPKGLTVKCPVLEQSIRLLDVSYQYPTGNIPVFSGLSVDIKKNQTVALMGVSGAGKSTLADLIAGLLEPDSGQIYCDDILLQGEERIAWRQNVAYVTQEVYLFHDTVRANLVWVSTEPVTDEQLWQVLKMTAADEFVQNLPKGLDTLIGDHGIRLSGGERQRLAMARALLSKPQLLILDEASSALDYENEKKIQLALAQMQGKLTILIIAHREASIASADKRIFLDIPD